MGRSRTEPPRWRCCGKERRRLASQPAPALKQAAPIGEAAGYGHRWDRYSRTPADAV